MRTGPRVLDGGTGTSLLDRGLQEGALPERWVLERPAEVAAVHAGFARAGASIALTCTFNLPSPRLDAARLSIEPVASAAVRLARASGAAQVAGALGPSGLVAPGAALPAGGELQARYAAACRALAAAGVDLLWLETQYVPGEARAALAAARATGLATVVTLTSGPGELLLPGGEPVRAALEQLAQDGALAVGVNCVAPSAALERLVHELAPELGIPLVVKPTAGLPGAVAPPDEFAARVAALARAGAAWVGGCCGAGERHVAALAAAVG